MLPALRAGFVFIAIERVLTPTQQDDLATCFDAHGQERPDHDFDPEFILSDFKDGMFAVGVRCRACDDFSRNLRQVSSERRDARA